MSAAWPFQASLSTLSKTLTCSSSILSSSSRISSARRVLRAQQLGELVRDDHVQAAHLDEGRAERLRHDLVGEAVAGELCDVLGDVAHPLERGADPQRGHDGPQVAGDRSLAGEDVDRQLVEADGQLVDAGVAGDDLLGEETSGG